MANRTLDAVDRSLVDLVGEPRATIVRLLKRNEHSAPQLAGELGITDVAVRRHLELLENAGLITSRTVNQGRGRPVARYRLTERGEHLFPHRYVELVDELFAYLADERGRSGISGFLRWRQEREAAAYAQAVDGVDAGERLEQLRTALAASGYEASVTETDDGGWKLTQTHCAIYDVAREHPEVCAHEAAAFKRVLGDEVRISRRETLANGDGACVCVISPVSPVSSARPADQLPLAD